MKRCKLLAPWFLFLFLSISYFSFYTKNAKASSDLNLQGQIPRAEFASTYHDFGNIYRGQIVSTKFPFENTGNGTLVLTSLHAACGCLNTKTFADDSLTPKNIFKPGEKGVISVEFDSGQFAGPITRTVTAETNIGTALSTVTMTISANILQEVTSNPALIYFGKVDKNDQKTLTATLSLNGRGNVPAANTSEKIIKQIESSKVAASLKDKILSNKDLLKVFSVESNLNFVSAKIVSTAQSDKMKIELKLNNSQNIPVGPFSGYLTVWNNSSHDKNFEIPVVGEVAGDVSVSAKFIEFGVLGKSDQSARNITLRSTNKQFSIIGVKVNLKKLPEFEGFNELDFFDIQKSKLANSSTANAQAGNYNISVKLRFPKKLQESTDAHSNDLNVSGSFVILTSDADYKTINVPFFGVLKRNQDVL